MSKKFTIAVAWGVDATRLDKLNETYQKTNALDAEIKSGNFTDEEMYNLRIGFLSELHVLKYQINELIDIGAEIKTYSFNTQEEADAFFKGIIECVAWNEWEVIEEKDSIVLNTLISEMGGE